MGLCCGPRSQGKNSVWTRETCLFQHCFHLKPSPLACSTNFSWEQFLPTLLRALQVSSAWSTGNQSFVPCGFNKEKSKKESRPFCTTPVLIKKKKKAVLQWWVWHRHQWDWCRTVTLRCEVKAETGVFWVTWADPVRSPVFCKVLVQLPVNKDVSMEGTRTFSPPDRGKMEFLLSPCVSLFL